VEPDELDSISCGVNSNFVAIAAIKSDDMHSKLNIYDLKCLEELDVVPSHLLLTSIDLGTYLGSESRIAMNESRIVCVKYSAMDVIDLSLIHRLRCPEPC
jgi:hypothetical protein